MLWEYYALILKKENKKEIMHYIPVSQRNSVTLCQKWHVVSWWTESHLIHSLLNRNLWIFPVLLSNLLPITDIWTGKLKEGASETWMNIKQLNRKQTEIWMNIGIQKAVKLFSELDWDLPWALMSKKLPNFSCQRPRSSCFSCINRNS